jgi:hypothetical protein
MVVGLLPLDAQTGKIFTLFLGSQIRTRHAKVAEEGLTVLESDEVLPDEGFDVREFAQESFLLRRGQPTILRVGLGLRHAVDLGEIDDLRVPLGRGDRARVGLLIQQSAHIRQFRIDSP